jgi:hypothetical protein
MDVVVVFTAEGTKLHQWSCNISGSKVIALDDPLQLYAAADQALYMTNSKVYGKVLSIVFGTGKPS